MGFVNFNKVNPYKLEFVYPGLFYKYNDKWICLATNCKMSPMIDSEPGFRYLDTDGLIHHFYDEVETSDIPYYEKHESYERVRSAGNSVVYTVTEYAILKYSEDLYYDEPWVKEVLDRLNDTTKLVSDNPYTTFKPVKEDTANGIKD